MWQLSTLNDVSPYLDLLMAQFQEPWKMVRRPPAQYLGSSCAAGVLISNEII
jgi:hypothetical protein